MKKILVLVVAALMALGLAVPASALETYTLAVTTDPVDLVTITGGGPYSEGTLVPLTAPSTATKAYEFYVFTHWDVDEVDVSGNPITVLMDAAHTATANYDKVLSINKELVYPPSSVVVGTLTPFYMKITLTTFAAVLGVKVTDGIGADLAWDATHADPDLVASTGTVSERKAGKGKMGAKVVTWTLGDLDAGVSPTLDLFVQTGLNPKAKQEFTSLGDHSLNDGPTASFTYNGNQYTLKGPAVIVTVVAAP